MRTNSLGWLCFPVLVLAGCFDSVSLQSCETADDCPVRYPVCKAGRCFHHSLESAVLWCASQTRGVEESCCNLLADGALGRGACNVQVALTGLAVAGPVWVQERGLFQVVNRTGEGDLLLFEFSSRGEGLRTVPIPLKCQGERPELRADGTISAVSCSRESFVASASDTWTWEWSDESGGPTRVCGATHAVRLYEKGLEIHMFSGGMPKQMPLQMGSFPFELDVACGQKDLIAYVPTRGGDVLEVVDLGTQFVVATLQDPALGGRMLALALGTQDELWVLHQDGAVSAWEPSQNHVPALRWRVSGFGRPEPVSGSFGAASEVAWYVGVDKRLVVSSEPGLEHVIDAPDGVVFGFVPLKGGDWVFLMEEPAGSGLGVGSVRVSMLYETWPPVWPSGPARRRQDVTLLCRDIQWSEATPDGVFAIRCDGEVHILTTPAPGQRVVWQSGGGARRTEEQ